MTRPEPGAGAGRALPVVGVTDGRTAHAAAETQARLADAGAYGTRSDPEPIELDADEAELIELELEAMGPVPSADRRRAYRELRGAVHAGTVPAGLVPLLERLVAVSLESGRARRRYLAEGEKVLTGLFRRTPAGRELLSNLKGVNAALEVLQARTLIGVTIGLRTLGHFRIGLETEDVRLTLSVRPHGVRLESLAVRGGGG